MSLAATVETRNKNSAKPDGNINAQKLCCFCVCDCLSPTVVEEPRVFLCSVRQSVK